MLCHETYVDTSVCTAKGQSSLVAYWVDLLLEGDKTWMPLFTYSSLANAEQMRDHWKGVKPVEGYTLCLNKRVVDARVRVVEVKVTLYL